MKKPTEKLRDYLREDKVIILVGAGASAFAAQLPGWAKLLQSGIKYAEDRHITTVNTAIATCLNENKFLAAGDILKQTILNTNALFSGWLKEVFGGLYATETSLHNAIADLCCPCILTTNYDTLLTDIPQFNKPKLYIHDQYQEALIALSKQEEFIMHLHGVFTKPNSVILSESDYTALNNNLGYKDFLKTIFNNYHVLFIGCSKDGLMDDDFLPVFTFIQEWFSNSANEHFILVQQKEIDKGNHIELIQKCNVTPIVYGSTYTDLPVFINSINPNFEKKKNKIDAYKQLLEKEAERLSNNLISVDEFIGTYINEYAVKDNSKTVLLLEALSQYNVKNKNSYQQLVTSQNIIKAIIDQQELKRQIKLWNEFYNNPEKLNNRTFIQTAVKAYNCLKTISSEIITAIGASTSRHALHYGFYTGNLASFGNEAEALLNRNLKYSESYNTDKYFFENLKRLMTSADNFIELTPSTIFPEVVPATITTTLPAQIIAITRNTAIDIYDYSKEEVIATLPLDSAYRYFDTQIIEWKNKNIIVCACAKYAFTWCPTEDAFITIFYEPENAMVNNIVVEVKDDIVLIAIKNGNKIVFFKNFIASESTVLLANQVTKIHWLNDGIIGICDFYSNYGHSAVEFFEQNGTIKTLATKDDLLNVLVEDETIEPLLISIRESTPFFIHGMTADSFIMGLQYEKIKNSQSDFLLITRLNTNTYTSVIYWCSYSNQKITYKKNIHCPYSVSICADAVFSGTELIITCGYLNMNSNKTIFEIITLDNNCTIKTRLPYNKKEKTLDYTEDVFKIEILEPHCFLVDIEHKELYKINLSSVPSIKKIDGIKPGFNKFNFCTLTEKE